MARILSIDYGKKRTGIAVTDPCQIIANGLTTVDTPRLMTFLKDYTQREAVERIIVGLPKQTNGLDSENLPRVQAFVAQLTKILAHQTMIESGISRKARRDKALVDTISATIILQGWMERRK